MRVCARVCVRACACACARARSLMATLPGGGPAEDGSELRSHACGVAKVETRGRAPGVGRIVIVTPREVRPRQPEASAGERSSAAPAATEDRNVGGSRRVVRGGPALAPLPRRRGRGGLAKQRVHIGGALAERAEHLPPHAGELLRKAEEDGACSGVRDVRMVRLIQSPSVALV